MRLDFMAERSGVRISDMLETLINTITEKPGLLPLLCHTLNYPFNRNSSPPKKLHSKKSQTYITSVRTAAEMLSFCYFTHGG
jgi:hypothetical protein